MIVPRTRLLVWSSLILLPFAAVGATLPGALPVALLFIGSFVACAVYDALVATRAVQGIRILLPDLVRLQKDRPGSFEVRVQNDHAAAARTVRIGFAFPPLIETTADDQFVTLPAGAPLASLGWTVTPRERGLFHLDRVYLEAMSPLGFWAKRTSQSVRTELRAYPNLFAERKQVAAFFLRRGLMGSRAHRQTGQGREFEKLREYLPGDSIDEIHWKASAKRGHPVTKVFQIERTQEVYVIVDASRLSARKVTTEAGTVTVLERFVTAALILGAAAERQGDQFGLLTFSDRVLSFVRAKNGKDHFDACRDRLYALQPQAVTPDFEELCAFIRLRLRKRALLIFLTDLDDPMLSESFSRSSDLISRQHLVLVNMMQPAGAAPLFENEAVAAVGEIYQRLGGHLRWHDLRELGKVLQRRGVRFALLDPQRLAAEVLAQHADVKARQLV